MSFLVTSLPRAEHDIDEIYVWLWKRSPVGAIHWYVSLLRALRQLEDRPERFAVAPEARRLGRDVRQMFFKTRHGRRYRILYIVVEQEVRVLRVWAPGKRPLRRGDIQ